MEAERAAIAAIRDSARTLAADVDVSELYGEFLAQVRRRRQIAALASLSL
jgi:hypothetical protein